MRFKFTALNQSLKRVEGEVEATDAAAAIAAVKGLGYRPISVNRARTTFSTSALFGSKKVKPDELAIFTRQLSTMISAGVSLLRGLNALSGKGETQLKETSQAVANSIEGGLSFADALAQHPKVFDTIYVNMVRAGEAAGILDQILKRLATQQEKSASMRKKIKSAMTYPIVLLSVTVVAFFGLMIFVIPQIGEVTTSLSGSEDAVPALTKAMLAISDFIVNWWFILIPLLVGGVFLLIRYIKSPTGKPKFDKLILKIPGINELVRKNAVASFSRTFSALMSAGVSVNQSLEITADALGNKLYQDSLLHASDRIKNGDQLSEVISKDQHLWPEIVGQMLAVGEETGTTDTVLLKVADFYEEEVDLAVEQLNSIIEPVMIVIMGGVVGLVAASVMLPISGMATAI